MGISRPHCTQTHSKNLYIRLFFPSYHLVFWEPFQRSQLSSKARTTPNRVKNLLGVGLNGITQNPIAFHTLPDTVCARGWEFQGRERPNLKRRTGSKHLT